MEMRNALPDRSLSMFTGDGYHKGRPLATQALWVATSALIFTKWWCPNMLRIAILRLFGGNIGTGVIIRKNVRVHWPWKLSIGDHSWIGEDAWLLNLEPIRIESDVCVSQGALLCTGSHDATSPSFEFDNAPIMISKGAWVAARATVLRGVVVGPRSVVGATALVTRDVPAGAVVYPPRSGVGNHVSHGTTQRN